MTASVLTAGIQIPADPRAPIRFDFELHALRMAFVEPANVHRRSPPAKLRDQLPPGSAS